MKKIIIFVVLYLAVGVGLTFVIGDYSILTSNYWYYPSQAIINLLLWPKTLVIILATGIAGKH